MKLTRNILRNLISEEYSLLTEQEEDVEAEDTEAEPAEDMEAEEEEATEEAEGEEAAEMGAEEEAEEVEPVTDEVESFAKSIDDELNSFFIDYEEEAIRVAQAETQKEFYSRPLATLLFEQEAVPQIDMETFAADVARLVKNYDSLLDMEAIILTKAEDYILSKYDQAHVEALLDILDLRYDLAIDIPEEEINPMAVGASSTAAEGGA